MLGLYFAGVLPFRGANVTWCDIWHLESILQVGGRGWVAHLRATPPPPPPPVNVPYC